MAQHDRRNTPAIGRQAASHALMLALCSLAFWLVACMPTAPIPEPLQQVTLATAPTLDDFWAGTARWETEVVDTGLPMGESDTLILDNGAWRSFVHASHQSLGVVDQCGAPVEFPGCLVIFTSNDQGRSFAPTLNADGLPVCQIECVRCPCDSRRDHIDQQQYPRVAKLSSAAYSLGGESQDQWLLTYEYRANTIVRRSNDGLAWSSAAEVPLTGIWREWLMPCPTHARIGDHPNTPTQYDCLVGSPPGIFIDSRAQPPELYIFVGLGQNPSAMGCYRGALHGPTSMLAACEHNPLFVGASDYGPSDSAADADANTHFDFRTISSADLVRVGERYYLFYEGVRGPRAGDGGDTQFLLGLARSMTSQIDGAWELYPHNPILLELPGNVGVGHADVVIAEGNGAGAIGTDGVTYLYTSLDGQVRSRLRLVWE